MLSSRILFWTGSIAVFANPIAQNANEKNDLMYFEIASETSVECTSDALPEDEIYDISQKRDVHQEESLCRQRPTGLIPTPRDNGKPEDGDRSSEDRDNECYGSYPYFFTCGSNTGYIAMQCARGTCCKSSSDSSDIDYSVYPNSSAILTSSSSLQDWFAE